MSKWSEEETDHQLVADKPNFCKVEKWTTGATNVDSLLYAGDELERTCEIVAASVKHRPRIRLTIRQRTPVLRQWPE